MSTPSTAELIDPPPAVPLEDKAAAALLVEAFRKISNEMGRFIVGQEEVIEQLVIAVLAGGHCLLEGVPGLAKTAIIRSLSQTMDLSFRRIQFTPDLMPSDITGTDIIQEDPATGHRRFVFQKGPIFTQMLLADEINRTPPKTQAALLEAMQEHNVTVGGHTLKLEEPFFVLATQNPIEQEGTYPLPEAQKDRFVFLVKVDYPDREHERQIIARTTGTFSAELHPIINGAQVIALQQAVRKVPVPDHVMDFVLDLVRFTRPHNPEAPAFVKDLIEWGAGPRACQNLVLTAKVRAVLRGRFHVTIDDIEALALPVLRHRVVPTFNAEAEGIKVDDIIVRILKAVPRGEAKRQF
ncbi:MAG TPA: MoxR family ATPase [Chthoniobacteraceae bacterium]|jgi:MoxR-like ATPase|nr:moxR [Chthoniobacter sp.]HEV7869328.1 MoxR family ATPase [Chthoniobacteraceae bacterium]